MSRNGRGSSARDPDRTRPRSGVRWGVVFAAVFAGLSIGAVRLYWAVSRSIEREPAPKVQVAERPPPTPPVSSLVRGVETTENGRKIVTLPSGLKLEQQDDGTFKVQKREPREQSE